MGGVEVWYCGRRMWAATQVGFFVNVAATIAEKYGNLTASLAVSGSGTTLRKNR
jgi:hypothetical protein